MGTERFPAPIRPFVKPSNSDYAIDATKRNGERAGNPHPRRHHYSSSVRWIIFVVERLAASLDESRLEIVAHQRGVKKAKDIC